MIVLLHACGIVVIVYCLLCCDDVRERERDAGDDDVYLPWEFWRGYCVSFY